MPAIFSDPLRKYFESETRRRKEDSLQKQLSSDGNFNYFIWFGSYLLADGNIDGFAIYPISVIPPERESESAMADTDVRQSAELSRHRIDSRAPCLRKA